MSSVTIRGGLLVDGTGAAARRVDVMVRDGSIVEVGDGPFEADEVIDATDRVVAPGFIDIHTHSDLTLLVDRRGLSKLCQGVTCEVVGNCGMSPAPLRPNDARQRDAMSYMDAGLEWNWADYAAFAARLPGSALNVASLVGHIALRSTVMDFTDRPPTDDDMTAMKRLLAGCCEAGAVGFSTGLIYPPSCYADTAEIAELCTVVARYDRLYASHIRGEGPTLQSSIAEAIEIGRRSGCRVQISHLKATGRANWGTVGQAIEQIERARAEGIDVAFDVYPYTAGATQLTALLPPWVHEGGREALLQRVRDPDVRRRIRDQSEGRGPAWAGYALRTPEDWAARRISTTHRPENEWLIGRDLWSLSEELGLAPTDAVCEIVARDDARAGFIAFHISEDDMRQVLAHPLAAVGSDGNAIVPEGELGRGRPHPRFYGTFPRVLGWYVREEGLLPLEEAVRKMTSLPAERCRLNDRGRVAVGCRADLVVFDPQTVRDVATFEDPHRYAAGIDHVIVNGEVALRHGAGTPARSGQLLTPG